MIKFIDVHSHIAWGIDDGIENEDDARVALQNAKNDGIEAMIATPHFIPGRYDQKDFEKATQRLNELKAVGKEYGMDIYLGCEFFLNDDYISMLEEKIFYPLANSSYVLMEFDVRKEIGNEQEVEDKFYEFIVRGYRPLIAHVERYFHSDIDLQRVEHWIDMGCYIQVNRTSLLGLGGKQSKKNADALMSAGLVHVIGSDMHQINGTRVGILSDVYDYIEQEYGVNNANVLCMENASKILVDKEMRMMEKPDKKKGIFKFWKRGR